MKHSATTAEKLAFLGYECDATVELDDPADDGADSYQDMLYLPWMTAYVAGDTKEAASIGDRAAAVCAPYLNILEKMAEIAVDHEYGSEAEDFQIPLRCS